MCDLFVFTAKNWNKTENHDLSRPIGKKPEGLFSPRVHHENRGNQRSVFRGVNLAEQQWFPTFFAQRTLNYKNGLHGPLNRQNQPYKNVLYDIQ